MRESRTPVEKVEHDNGHDDRDAGNGHDRGQVDADERDRLGRFGHLFGDGQHEDGEGEEDGDAERDFLSRVGRQTEHQHGQRRHHHAGEDDVVHVVERLPPDVQRHRDGREGLSGATRINALCSDDLNVALKFPFAVALVVLRVHVFAPAHDVNLQGEKRYFYDTDLVFDPRCSFFHDVVILRQTKSYLIAINRSRLHEAEEKKSFPLL